MTTSVVFVVQAPPGLINHFSALARAAGLPFRALRVQGGPISPLDPGEEDDDGVSVSPLLLRIERTADVLACSPTTVKRLIRAHILPAVKVGGATRVRVADLQAFVEGLGARPSEDSS